MRIASESPMWTCRLSGKSAFVPSIAISAMLLVGGCGSPNAANIELRKKQQDLETQLAQIQLQREADAATIKALEKQGSLSVPVLPAERMNKLFTVHSISLGRLTGGFDLSDSKQPYHDGLKIYVVPTDSSGDELKAAGTLKVEAFDLASPETRVGEWNFPAEQAPKYWIGSGLLYEYVLPCKFDKPPAHDELTLKVTFTDELTQRVYTAQKVVTIKRQSN